MTAGTIEWLSAGFTRQWHRAPDAEELRGLVTAHIREEVLCREALALGLDRDDTIVRRRLAQKMEFLTDDIAAAAEPDEAAVRKFFEKNAARYAKAGAREFSARLFQQGKARREAARRRRARRSRRWRKGASDETMGDPFLHGFEFAEREHAGDRRGVWARSLRQQVAALPTGEWRGPVASSYGCISCASRRARSRGRWLRRGARGGGARFQRGAPAHGEPRGLREAARAVSSRSGRSGAGESAAPPLQDGATMKRWLAIFLLLVAVRGIGARGAAGVISN